MIILLSGKMGSGKTETAKLLKAHLVKEGKPCQQFSFAWPIKEVYAACSGVLTGYGIPMEEKDRNFLQLVGDEWGRRCKDPDIWVKCAKNWYGWVERDSGSIAVIDDLRYQNEFAAFSEEKALFVRLTCPDEIRKTRCSRWSDKPHKSETDLDEWEHKFDLVINTHNFTPLQVVGKILETLIEKRLI